MTELNFIMKTILKNSFAVEKVVDGYFWNNLRIMYMTEGKMEMSSSLYFMYPAKEYFGTAS